MKKVIAFIILALAVISMISTLQVEPARYNIVLKPDCDIDAFVERHDFKLIRYNKAINVVTVEGKIIPFLFNLRDSQALDISLDGEVRIQGDPNDPRWGSQWGMQEITDNGESYNITTGSPDAVGVVIDTGVSATHEDFVKVQCIRSYVGGPCRDGHGHGTHVAGIMAAAINNNKGVAGVVSSRNTPIWGFKALTDSGSGTFSGVAQAITDAADLCVENNKRCVINMSLGGDSGGQSNAIMRRAIDYATNRRVVVISAAGNNNKSYCLTPAIETNSMCIGAVNQSLNRASFSNYGRGLDVVAPGVDIWSTVPEDDYRSWSGTSMATPHAAGAALAILSVHPSWSVSQVKDALRDTAAWHWREGAEEEYGSGLIDVVAALGRTPPEPNPTPTSTAEPRPTSTTRPKPTPTSPPAAFDYSDTASGLPVIRYSRTDEDPTVGNTVTTEVEAPLNELDDGGYYWASGKWNVLDGAELNENINGWVRLFVFFRNDVSPFSAGYIRYPSGKVNKLWASSTSLGVRVDVKLEGPGQYALRVLTSRERLGYYDESGQHGEVSDHIFYIGPKITPTPPPVERDFWLHCYEKDGDITCTKETPPN